METGGLAGWLVFNILKTVLLMSDVLHTEDFNVVGRQESRVIRL